MEAAAAVITSQRSSTGGNSTTASTESASATPAAVKTSTTASETGQTNTAASSTASRSAGSTQVSLSIVHGMLPCSTRGHVTFGTSCLTHRILQSFCLESKSNFVWLKISNWRLRRDKFSFCHVSKLIVYSILRNSEFILNSTADKAASSSKTVTPVSKVHQSIKNFINVSI